MSDLSIPGDTVLVKLSQQLMKHFPVELMLFGGAGEQTFPADSQVRGESEYDISLVRELLVTIEARFLGNVS